MRGILFPNSNVVFLAQGTDPASVPKDADGAKAALDRITIPQDVLGSIAATVPRSSLIVTDEPPSSETGNGTEFVVLLSGEPQGGVKKRRRSYGHPRTFWHSPFGSPFGW